MLVTLLQVSVQKEVGDFAKYRTTVFRKRTHTNLYTRWTSAHPPSQKLGTFHSLLWTAKRICSKNPVDYNREKLHLLSVFIELGYPINRLNQIVQKIDHPKPKIPRVENTVNMTLPYIAGVSEQIARAWKNTAKEHGLQIPTSVGYQATNKLKRLLVQPYPSDPPGQGIYEAKCTVCGKTYIGETGNFLESRIRTHKSAKNSSVKGHTHGISAFDWQFLARCHNNNKRKILEGFTIRKNHPELNKNTGVDSYIFM